MYIASQSVTLQARMKFSYTGVGVIFLGHEIKACGLRGDFGAFFLAFFCERCFILILPLSETFNNCV